MSGGSGDGLESGGGPGSGGGQGPHGRPGLPGQRELPMATPWPGARVLFVERTASTMLDARRLAGEGAASGTTVTAAWQERGRGRFPGRAWQSPPGQSLLFTTLLREPLGVPRLRLPLLAGLAVARCLERLAGLRPALKWPNDVLVEGRKLCGVLCEGSGDTVLVGVGLNVNQRAFPGGIAGRAVSLRQLLGRELEPLSLLEPLLAELARALADGAWQSPVDWRQAIEERLFLRGRPVRFAEGAPGGRVLRGELLGLSPDGALLLRPAGAPPQGSAPLELYSGELTAEEPSGSSRAGNGPQDGGPSPSRRSERDSSSR